MKNMFDVFKKIWKLKEHKYTYLFLFSFGISPKILIIILTWNDSHFF